MQKLQQRKNRKTMIEDAKSVYPVRMSLFDSSKFLFNCQNGTLDMNTLEFKPHDPHDFITKISPAVYDPDARCPRWDQFVDEVMQGRSAVAKYLQKAVGYSLTGDTSLECLFIMYGPTTRNGKTTTIDTILKLMGEYGRSAKPDMLASNFRGPSNGAPSEDVARLAGARFVGISEMEQKLTINASLTKQLTGNNKITARFLHENSFEFHLQAKIFIDTNHLPNVNDQTLFESGRIKIIPFNRHFEEHEQDKSLKSTLTDDTALSGILNWAVEGYRLYKSEGLDEPDDVKSATAQYRQDSDRISQFIDAWLEEGRDENHQPYEVPVKAAYRVYSRWCDDMNYRPENYKNFRAAMEKTFELDKKRPNTGGNMIAMIIGVRLREEEAGSEDEEGEVFQPLTDEQCKLT
jgi:putative DNA primase/helicase